MQPLLRNNVLPAAALLASTLVAVPGAAQTAEETQALALFAEGRAALEKGDHQTACARFSASLALVRRAGTLLNLAECEERGGKLAAAAGDWQAGLALLPPGDERIPIARERVAALAPRVPRLTVVLNGPAPVGARVEVDGAAVSINEITAGMAVDPGHHTIVLKVPGSVDLRGTVDLAERQAKSVTLSVGSVAPGPPPKGGSGLRAGGFALLGVGAAGFIVAGVTGGILLSKHSTFTSGCNAATHGCTQEGWDALHSMPPLNAANAVGWGVGLVGLASGVALVVVGGKTPATVTTAALPGGGGLWMTGRF